MSRGRHLLENIYWKCHNHRRSSQTETFCRYFTESWEIFTTNAIITDVFTDGYIPSVFHRELKNIYFICHYHIQNISIDIFLVEIFLFWRAFSVCKTIGIFFTDRMWNYWRKLCRQMHSVGELIGKKFTDGVIISHRRNRSVSKPINCCSDIEW
jgi:hypothetical protein